jgi:hypothetical protein
VRRDEKLPSEFHYTFVEICPSAFRGIALRILEWRAARVRDPVARLQFLQRKSPPGGKPAVFLRRLPAPALTLGLALIGAAILRPWATSRPPRADNQPRTALRQNLSPPIVNSLPRVWRVETNKQYDLYSNGLRVENQFTAATVSRNYLAYPRSRFDGRSSDWRSKPAGIVFHTTESHLAPFQEQQNQELRRAGEGLLEYVNRQRSYHFVIDRFGRVFRVVQESDYANHAGNSVWADDDWIYLNLNQSFFGIAFEARSNPDGTQLPINAAQIHAGRILVEMLRARYAIPAANCVAHAQVSVNPGNGRAGYHTDWAANLPFAALGLTDNYARPLPSLLLFGFEADAALLQAGGAPLQEAIDAAAESIRREAAGHNLTVEKYRHSLLQQYRQAIAAQRRGQPIESQ